jgi:hypothetical protein
VLGHALCDVARDRPGYLSAGHAPAQIVRGPAQTMGRESPPDPDLLEAVLESAAPSATKAPSAGPLEQRSAIPADLKGPVELSSAIGAELYLQDKASWIGTDAMLERVGADDRKAIGGYVTIREGDDDGRPKLARLGSGTAPRIFAESRLRSPSPMDHVSISLSIPLRQLIG